MVYVFCWPMGIDLDGISFPVIDLVIDYPNIFYKAIPANLDAVKISIFQRCRRPVSTVMDGIVIEDDVWISFGVTILKGVRIGCGSIIAAGSLVTDDVPPGMIYRCKVEPIISPISY